MTRLIALMVAASVLVPFAAFADQFVSGYTRSDGTYVAPHYRSTPDSSYNNNWGVQGNINPYTGAMGTQRPTYNDHTPSYNIQQFGNPGYMTNGGFGGSYGSNRHR
jgi:hypothetical protein